MVDHFAVAYLKPHLRKRHNLVAVALVAVRA
jgi:hypothetical protein